MGYWPSVRWRWLYYNIGKVLFYDVHKLAKREWRQYPAVLTVQDWSIKGFILFLASLILKQIVLVWHGFTRKKGLKLVSQNFTKHFKLLENNFKKPFRSYHLKSISTFFFTSAMKYTIRSIKVLSTAKDSGNFG